MLSPFIIKALIAGCGISVMAGPLGCFVLWQRLAYFGDTIAHAALLGVVIALAFNINLTLGIIAIAIIITVAVFRLEQKKELAADSLLGIFAHGALALGLVIISISENITVDINGLLFGDILAVTVYDIALICAVAAVVASMLVFSWRDLMRLTLHPDIAKVEGVKVETLRLLLMIAIAFTVAVSIKIVGILLITSMLIIPAASVRALAKTPTQMALLSALAGIIAVCGGLYASMQLDTPSGPSIILAGIALFMAGYVLGKLISTDTGT